MQKLILVAACMVSISGVASAGNAPGGNQGPPITHFNEPHFNQPPFGAPQYPNNPPGYPPGNPSGVVKAPEIDAASAAGALTLLLGGVAVLGGRRRHQGLGAKI